LKVKPLYKDSSSAFLGLIEELSINAGFDKDFLLYHFSDLKDEPFNVISKKIAEFLDNLQKEA
jgi:hypothetical protein